MSEVMNSRWIKAKHGIAETYQWLCRYIIICCVGMYLHLIMGRFESDYAWLAKAHSFIDMSIGKIGDLQIFLLQLSKGGQKFYNLLVDTGG